MLNSAVPYTNPLPARLGADFLGNIPHVPGVYFFLDQHERPLYVGKAVDLQKRLRSYWKLRPGSERDHLLEMIESTHKLTWNVCANETAAIQLESELIRDLLPPYNIAGTWETRDFFISLSSDNSPESARALRFELKFDDDEFSENIEIYGCFKNDGFAKRGYPALLRLLHLLGTKGRWYHHPAAISRAYLPTRHDIWLPKEMASSLRNYMQGKNLTLLREISVRLIENESVPPFLASSIQQDLLMASAFFRRTLKVTRRIKKEAGIPPSRPLPIAKLHDLNQRRSLKKLRSVLGPVR
ncbi:MAG: nucleotide excision repair endonuclease [Oligoflexia bacterium]|nr:nucleotide excision repair endonuclease [Oligoflexia bacterium]